MPVTKKLINDVDRCVDDNLQGLVAVNPGLRLLKGHRVVIRSDIDDVISAGKVTILSGGGSGHEPGHAGYVGPGMLSASVAGSIFTSPPQQDILAGLRAIGRNNSAGVLVTINNYTGDRLTFGPAIEKAKTEGIKIALYINADDCALESVDKTAGRRGLAGGILAIKIAGAMAEDGNSLEQIVEILKFVSENMGTIGLCLTPCSLPGYDPTFQLNSDEIGLGLGLHGEAGAQTIKMTTARNAVKIMIDHMTSPANQTHLKVVSGDRVACALNNLGSTTFTEMNILAKEIIEYLEKRGVLVERFYAGHIITSQEMSGISITLLHLNDALRQALDSPTTAPGWRFVPCLPAGKVLRETPSEMDRDVSELSPETSAHPECISVPPETRNLIVKTVECVCQALVKSEGRLNYLDRDCGDGDCGSTFKHGATAIMQRLASQGLPTDRPYELALTLASMAEEAMGGSSGGLYSLFLTAASVPLRSTNTPDAWCKALQEGISAIMEHGGAAPGYRTMLDALCPAEKAFSSALQTLNGTDAFDAAVKAAEAGADCTAGMKAQAGRASYVSSSSLGNPDPGAIAVAVWMRAILHVLKSSEN